MFHTFKFNELAIRAKNPTKKKKKKQFSKLFDVYFFQGFFSHHLKL